MNTTTQPPRADKDRQIKLVEFAILVFKRLQQQGETDLYSDEEIAAGAMDALIYRVGYEKLRWAPTRRTLWGGIREDA